MTNHAKLLSEAFDALERHNKKDFLSYWEKQLILYTKGHFGRTNYKKDLKYFPSELYGLSLEHTDDYNVLGMVVRLYQKLVDHGHIPFKIENFIDNIFKRARFEKGKSEVVHEDILRQLLAEIQGVAVMENGVRVLELGKSDEELKEVIRLEIEQEKYINKLEDEKRKKENEERFMEICY